MDTCPRWKRWWWEQFSSLQGGSLHCQERCSAKEGSYVKDLGQPHHTCMLPSVLRSAVDYSELGYIVSSLKFPHYRMACGLLKAVILPLCVWWFRTWPGIVLQLTHLLSQLWETLFCCVDTEVLINAAPLLWENKCYRIIPALRVYSDSVIIANVAHVLGQGLSTSWRSYVPRSYVFSPPPI